MLFRKKSDPLSVRAKELNAQITALEAEIRQLSARAAPNPREAGTARAVRAVRGLAPAAAALPGKAAAVSEKAAALPGKARPNPPAARDPVFEPLDYKKPTQPAEADASEAHFNELGVRKYDLAGALRRLRQSFGTSAVANPKLVSYLAAGSIRGLRPLRYEKRVARNRFVLLSTFFILILWGIIAAVSNQR